jgi:signal transduction histidine kinase
VEHLLEAVIAEESRGTVLALAISRSIIAAQGGTLEAIRREGEVTCVRIELPRVNSPYAHSHGRLEFRSYATAVKPI